MLCLCHTSQWKVVFTCPAHSFVSCVFFDCPFVYICKETCTCVLFVCGSAVSIWSVAVVQECVEQSCVGACRSYFGLSCDAAAAF